jgi:hypothetical protein
MPKKTLKIPSSRFYKAEADRYYFPYIEKGSEIILNVADLIKWPTTADLIISCYYVGNDTDNDGNELYHFSEYNCCYERHAFKNHKVLCVGTGTWHLPGNCKINKYSPYKVLRRR